jgi:hypothetical protein
MAYHLQPQFAAELCACAPALSAMRCHGIQYLLGLMASVVWHCDAYLLVKKLCYNLPSGTCNEMADILSLNFSRNFQRQCQNNIFITVTIVSFTSNFLFNHVVCFSRSLRLFFFLLSFLSRNNSE